MSARVCVRECDRSRQNIRRALPARQPQTRHVETLYHLVEPAYLRRQAACHRSSISEKGFSHLAELAYLRRQAASNRRFAHVELADHLDEITELSWDRTINGSRAQFPDKCGRHGRGFIRKG